MYLTNSGDGWLFRPVTLQSTLLRRHLETQLHVRIEPIASALRNPRSVISPYRQVYPAKLKINRVGKANYLFASLRKVGVS